MITTASEKNKNDLHSWMAKKTHVQNID